MSAWRLIVVSTDRRRQRGQAIALAAVLFIVLAGMAGLVMDGGHDYLVRRQAQAAADFAALAAGKQLALLNSFLNGAPTSGSKPVLAAHDYAASNGFSTVFNTSCDQSVGTTSFATSWFNSGYGGTCSATRGFTTKVSLNVPASPVPGYALPPQCSGSTQYNCVQVNITQQVFHWFMGALGLPSAYVTTSATVFAQPPGNTFNTPPPMAVYLYEPATGCTGQCFNETKPALRQNLSCDSTQVPGANCPTFWVRPGSSPLIAGVDGKLVQPAADVQSVQVAGDSVIQDPTTLCDPYNGATCTANSAVGAMGFARASQGKVYCSGSVGALFGSGCTTTGQTGLRALATNETGYSPNSWTPSVNVAGLASCGALVLNGDTISNSYSAPGSVLPPSSTCYPPATEPYTVQPGVYSYIVVNHGAYRFEAGVYDITGKAPVNTASGGSYLSNGIDHSREGAADFDLCTGGTPTSCGGASPLTAGIWIGHGGGSYTAATTGTAAQCAFSGGGTPGVQGGGGDVVDIGGTSVTFRFESGAGGFVSTAEVHSIGLISPGLGQVQIISGLPLLFDLENNSFIHLDSMSAGGPSQFTGLVYQTPGATGGGVELDPGLANQAGKPALTGQIRAYSLTTFGRSGKAVSFTSGYGTSSVPPVTTSGRAEPWIIAGATMTAAINGAPGMETFTLNYVDEWALDAYGLYVKINNGGPIFFSQGIWNPPPLPSQPVPPANNNPGDANPAYPDSTVTGATNYTTALDANGLPDWTISIGNGTPNPTLFEVDGNWTWGHESEIPGATANWGGSFFGANNATINFTFPTPPGSSVHIEIFMTDGDFCGDYADGSFTFNNIGQPNGGVQAGGVVNLVQ